jgi:transcriptional regulator with XRE-family HTH domain
MKNRTFGCRSSALPLPLADLDHLPFDQLLRRLRQSRRLRQVDLGSMAWMDASMISRLENGGHTPDASDVARLAMALHLTIPEHDALRHAFERLVLKSRAPRSDILVKPLAALQLVDAQKAVVRRIRSEGSPELAIRLGEMLTDWIQLLAHGALSDSSQQALTEQLADVLEDQFRSYLEYLLPLRAEGGSPELPPSLVTVASRLIDLGVWRALEFDSRTDAPAGLPLHTFRLGLDAIRLGRQGSLRESLLELTSALENGRLEGPAADLLSLHCAHTMRNVGRYDDAERLYEGLATREGLLQKRAAYQRADLEFVRGRFQPALDSLRVSHDDIHLHGESLRLTGHVYRINALFNRADEVYQEALGLARWSSSSAMEGKALTNLVEALSWTRPERARAWWERAVAVNETAGDLIELVKIHGAMAVAADTDDESREHLHSGRELAHRIGYEGGVLITHVAQVFRSIVIAGETSPIEPRREVEEAVRRMNAHAYWLDIFDMWEGRSLGSRAQWLGGAVAAGRRWQQVVELRRR